MKRKSADRCYPCFVWSETPNGSNYYEHELVNGAFKGPYNYANTWAFSVRCVPGFGKRQNSKPLQPDIQNMQTTSQKHSLKICTQKKSQPCPLSTIQALQN